MGLGRYEIVAQRDRWSILHDGAAEGSYDSKEAAFEAIVIAAPLAVREGHEVTINVPGRDVGTGTTTGILAEGRGR